MNRNTRKSTRNLVLGAVVGGLVFSLAAAPLVASQGEPPLKLVELAEGSIQSSKAGS